MSEFNWGEALGGLGNLWGGYENMQNANSINRQVQGITGQQQGLASNIAQGLQAQSLQGRQYATDAYNRSLADVTSQNQGLEGNIGTMTQNLNSLSDPNSAYMQMARQAIERKDAAAGRRSQWGEREVQLAGTLADYVGKYAPGMNNSISNSRNQISQNNQGLGRLWNEMTMSSDRNNLGLTQLMNSLNGVAQNANTTGRQAQNSARNGVTSLLGSVGGGLGRLFGNMGAGNMLGITDQSGGGMDSGYVGLNNWFGSGSGEDGGNSVTNYTGPTTIGSDYFGAGNMYGAGNWASPVDNWEPPIDFNNANEAAWD